MEFLQRRQLKIGEKVPDFTLPSMDGKTYRLSDPLGHIVVIDWWSAECPASARYDAFFNSLLDSYAEKGVKLLAIDSNAIYDDDEIRRIMKARSIRFPILRDRGSKIADVFGAITTPHVFVLGPDGSLAYEGAIDDQSWSNTKPTQNYLLQVLDALLAGKPSPFTFKEPFGCSVKRSWKE